MNFYLLLLLYKFFVPVEKVPDIASCQGKCSIREGLFLVSNSILFQPFVLFFSRIPPENNT